MHNSLDLKLKCLDLQQGNVCLGSYLWKNDVNINMTSLSGKFSEIDVAVHTFLFDFYPSHRSDKAV